MANTMHKTVNHAFLMLQRVIACFHIQKPAYDALQEMRIKHRRDAVNEATDAMENAKSDGQKYKPEILSNGDTSELYKSISELYKFMI